MCIHDFLIYPNNFLKSSEFGQGVTIYLNNVITDCKIAEKVKINSSNAEKATVEACAEIGPFARLRPNAKIAENAHIGNFVEVKNATVGKGTKASHLTYIGDCDIGENCNVGCGVIFVNYNGREKNRTNVGDNCFIGSNCNIIAPVNIASDSYICAGTTVTDDVNTDDFVIGRVRQEVKAGRASRYLKNNKEQ